VPEPLRLFVGYDERESVAYHVLCQSLLSRASGPISIAPLVQPALRQAGLYWRERNPLESTAFSFTRFLIPALCGFSGKAVFLDSDILARCDIMALWDEIDSQMMAEPWFKTRGSMPLEERKAVLVCQHDYVPKADTKFLGQPQTAYERKNWSSVMVFDNSLCRALTPEYVNTATGLELHRFKWLPNARIGSLDLYWNWLVGVYPTNPAARLIHFTDGGPWFAGYEIVDYADEWRGERDAALGEAVAV
jgi:hypothetical protein